MFDFFFQLISKLKFYTTIKLINFLYFKKVFIYEKSTDKKENCKLLELSRTKKLSINILKKRDDSNKNKIACLIKKYHFV